jgi:hypothetical protein
MKRLLAAIVCILPLLVGNVGVSAASQRQVVTIKARWIYYGPVYETRVITYARVKVFGTVEGQNVQLGQGHVKFNGNLEIQADVTGASSIYLVVYTADDYTVTVMSNHDNFATTYSAISPARAVSSGTSVVDFGVMLVPAGAASKAWYIYSLIADLAWNYLASTPAINWDNWGTGGELRVEWSENSIVGATYNHTRKTVFLIGVNAWEPDIVLHEVNHYIHHKVYGELAASSGGCSGWDVSGPGTNCAFNEGWPTFLQAAMQGHRRYQGTAAYDENIRRTRDLEIPRANGVNTPGAVVGFLFDIYDPRNETCDGLNNGINGANLNGIWNVFKNYEPANEIEFINDWGTSGNGLTFQVDVLAKHHGILSSASPCKNQYVYIPIVETPPPTGEG